MPPTPIVVLEIDDNTPPSLPPFTHDVSMWSFKDDFNLATRTAADTFRAIHAAFGGAVFRGYPERAARGTIELFDRLAEADDITWLTAAELADVGRLLPSGDSPIERTVRVLFGIITVTGRHFGADRVRLVFTFL